MKKVLLFLFFFIVNCQMIPIKIGNNCFAQTPVWVWARNANAWITEGEGSCIATDDSENVYFGGFYTDSISFGPYILAGNHSPQYYGCIYIAKFDSSGNIKWAKTSVNISTSAGATAGTICVDAFGNCYTTGQFNGIISFGSDTLTSIAADIFLVKYDSHGNVLWANRAGGAGANLISQAVATDSYGNVFITGGFNLSAVFGPDTLTSAGGKDIFLAKYDSFGNLLWVKSVGGSGLEYAWGVATDASGNAYITGLFASSTLSFGLDTLRTTTGDCIFLAKYDSLGNLKWAKSSVGTTNDYGYAVAIDSTQDIYITGSFTSPAISFGSDTLFNAGNEDAFIVKYDSSGSVLWAKNLGGSADDEGYYIAADKYGKIYLTGRFISPAITIDTITLLYPGGSLPMFIAAFNSSGHVLFANALPDGGDFRNEVTTGPSGNVYIGGDISSYPFIIGKDSLKNSMSNTESVFIAKLSYSAPTAAFVSSDTTICTEGNNCINFFDNSTGNPTNWQWYFPGGFPGSSSSQNPTNICYNSPGSYPVTLIVANALGRDTLTVSPMITVSVCVGIDETDSSGQINIYPNPASQSITISWQSPVGGNANITVVNVLGEKVYGEESASRPPSSNGGLLHSVRNESRITIDVSSLTNGVYFLKIESGESRVLGMNKKFVVVH